MNTRPLALSSDSPAMWITHVIKTFYKRAIRCQSYAEMCGETENSLNFSIFHSSADERLC